LRNLGVLSRNDRDATTARRLLEEALSLFRARHDLIGMASSLVTLGDLLLHEGDLPAGQAMLKGCRARFAELDHSLGMALVSVLLGEDLPPGLLADIGLPLVKAAWRHNLACELPASVSGAQRLPDGASRTLADVGHASFPDHLTRREVEVLAFLARRATNREIADALVLSVRTVERHISNIYAKTNLAGRHQARGYAERHRLDYVFSTYREAAGAKDG